MATQIESVVSLIPPTNLGHGKGILIGPFLSGRNRRTWPHFSARWWPPTMGGPDFSCVERLLRGLSPPCFAAGMINFAQKFIWALHDRSRSPERQSYQKTANSAGWQNRLLLTRCPKSFAFSVEKELEVKLNAPLPRPDRPSGCGHW